MQNIHKNQNYAQTTNIVKQLSYKQKNICETTKGIFVAIQSEYEVSTSSTPVNSELVSVSCRGIKKSRKTSTPFFIT